MTEAKKTTDKNRLELLQTILDSKAKQVKMAKDYNKLQIQYNDLLRKTNGFLIDHYNTIKDLNFAITALKYIAENEKYGLHDENTDAAVSALSKLRTPSSENPILNELQAAQTMSESQQQDVGESADHPLADRNPNGDNQENS